MRKKIVAGNWKMNNDLNKSLALISDLLKKVPQTDAEVMIAPTFVNLIPAVDAAKGSKIEVIAQICTLPKAVLILVRFQLKC